MTQHDCTKKLLIDQNAEKLWYLVKTTKAKFKPVSDFAGHVGEVVGRGIGWIVGWLLVAIVLVSLFLVLAFYIAGSALASWLDEQRTEYRRRRLTPRQKKQILESQGWKCYYGGKPLDPTCFDIDHKTPFSDIRNDTDRDEIEHLSNLVATCLNHNRKKRNMNEAQFREWMKTSEYNSCYMEVHE